MGVVGRLDQYASMLAYEFDDYSMSENLITYSEDISQYHYIDNVSISTNQIISPDGTTTADKLTSTITGGTNTCFVQKFSAVSIDTATYTFSVFLKAGTSPQTLINLQLAGGTYQQSRATINWTSNTITASDGGTSALVSYPNGWYRVSITLTNNGTNNAIYPRVYVRGQGTDNVNGEFVYIWGMQVEKGSVATDYTPTSGTAISRVLPATTNTNITGLGTYYSSGFDENVGFTTFLPANIFAPYDLVYDEFGGTLFGAGQGRYMRQNTDKSVIVYNEIDEVSDFRDIVRSGLVLDLDAGMNSSFNNTGTTWYDLSGGATNFTLTNPTYYSYSSSNNGSILFTRTTSPTPEDGAYATTTTTGSLSALTYLHNNHTTEVWFKVNDRNPTNYDATETASALVVYSGFHSMFYYESTSFTYSIWGKDGSNANANYALAFADSSVGTWNQIVARRSGTELKLYLNGVLKNTGTINVLGTGTPSSNTLRLATANPSGLYSWHSNVNIASLKMYNKALTDNEISQNYNALRNRFGL